LNRISPLHLDTVNFKIPTFSWYLHDVAPVLSTILGWKAVLANAIGAVASWFGPVGFVVSQALSFEALFDGAASQAIDCAVRGWDSPHCKAGWVYVGGMAAATGAAPPGIGNGISFVAGIIWMAT
jgi:hypothetical protein